jgi:hypothetical protein
MSKGVVFFFEGAHMSWYATQVTYSENTVRGFVRDGFWWMDYNTETGTVNVCTPKAGTVNWESPINVMTKMKLLRQVSVPVDFAGDYNETMEWAKNE